jgi:acyl-CoA dehydrogenase
LVTNATAARERLCHQIYWTLEPTNPLGLLQEALLLAQSVEPIEKRIRVEGVKTGKVTALDLPGSETEGAALREYDRKMIDLISVDDFAPHELGTKAEPVPQAPARSSVHVA